MQSAPQDGHIMRSPRTTLSGYTSTYVDYVYIYIYILHIFYNYIYIYDKLTIYVYMYTYVFLPNSASKCDMGSHTQDGARSKPHLETVRLCRPFLVWWLCYVVLRSRERPAPYECLCHFAICARQDAAKLEAKVMGSGHPCPGHLSSQRCGCCKVRRSPKS